MPSATGTTPADTTKPKKEKKEKKFKRQEAIADTSNSTDEQPSSAAIDEGASKKRKRKEPLPDEIEVDVSLPEPPSKKQLRLLKKGKSITPTATALANAAIAADTDDLTGETTEKPQHEDEKRTAHGIWIGNLPFPATVITLREFLTANESIPNSAITRINMPVPHNAQSSRTQLKPQNKGFAYVDFKTKEAMEAALTLSESMLGGRRVLIKDSTSYAGRPEKPKATENGETPAGDAAYGKTKAIIDGIAGQPSKRVFVGNLSFDVTKDELREHYAKCGTVEDIFMATFEDSGKCKGFAWVRFAELEAAEAAVRGWLRIPDPKGDDSGSEESEEEAAEAADSSDEEGEKKTTTTKKPKRARKPRTRKWFVNKLVGRPLRCEFAEDASTRYKKRYGKDAPPGSKATKGLAAAGIEEVGGEPAPKMQRGKKAKKQTQEIQPGAPTDANRRRGRGGEDAKPNVGDETTRYRTGAIAEATGKKTSFE